MRTEKKPWNPVYIVVTERETSDGQPGQLSDAVGELYRYWSNEDLEAGETYLVDTDVIGEKTVRITDSWNDTEDR